MARMLARVAPWLPSAKYETESRSGRSEGGLRVLRQEDTTALWQLAAADPVANIFALSHLEAARSAAPSAGGGQFVGFFDDDGVLAHACWAGVNVVPIGVPADHGAHYGRFLARSRRRYSSIFGPAEGVLSVWSELRHSAPQPFDVRPEQPLLSMGTASPVPPAPALRTTRPGELDTLLPACTAMFEEEVGYSPVAAGDRQYRQRVQALIAKGHSLSHIDAAGQVVFKAELGTVSSQAVQIQGVWMNPQYRGQGRSGAYMSAVVAAAQQIAPLTSLYVNSYNAPARATYESVGFDRVGTFATILF